MTTVDIVLLVVVLIMTITAAVLALAETSITRMSRSRAAALAQKDPKGGARRRTCRVRASARVSSSTATKGSS